jgi:hypothetical protein
MPPYRTIPSNEEPDSLTSVQAFGRTLTLAREQKLASYDAAYLELALRLDLPLATNDKQLIDAALRCQVELLNPALNGSSVCLMQRTGL